LKIRIKFRKYGVMKFIGHLDIMRYFQKAMRRADIDICYSEGFSPHQIMSFAAPLGVGITSDGEYLDIEVHSSKSTRETLADLNSTMVEGVEITGYVKLPDNAKTAMSLVAAADYRLFFKEGYDIPFIKSEAEQAIEAYFTKPAEVLITKQTKKSEKIMDLKQLVYEFKAEGTEETPEFYINLSTGSSDNLKPELVLESLFNYMNVPYNANAIQIHRIDVYAKENDKFISLLDMGEEIA
jgi:radical SAM-linked protein